MGGRPKVYVRSKDFRVEGFQAYGRGAGVSFLGVGFSRDADIECPNKPGSIPVLQCRIWGLEFTVWGFGLRVKDLGLRV